MAQSMTATISRAKSTEKDDLSGATAASSLALSITTTSKVKESMNGTMADVMKETGKIIKWTAMASSHGQTAENMKESINPI
jgi:hypothetical protein